MLRSNYASYGLLLLVAMALLSTAAFGQTTVVPVTISNGYIGLTTYSDGDDYSGRFWIFNVAGDPSDPRDDNQDLLNWGEVEVMVSSTMEVDGQPAAVWLPFKKAQEPDRLSAIIGEKEHGTWIVSPYVVPGEQCIKSIWTPDKPKEGEKVNLIIEQEIRLLHDMVRFKWTILNGEYINHQVGFRISGDVITEPMNTGTENQANVVSMPGFPLIQECSFYPNTNMPSSVQVFNSQSDPSRGIKVTLEGMGATRPDMLGIDEWYNISSYFWTYAADPYAASLKPLWYYEVYPEDQPISSNLAYGAFWKPIQVYGGKSRTIVHYIGNPGSNSVTNMPSVDVPKYTASVGGPRALKYYVDSTSGAESFSPSTFRITANLENLDKLASLRNCTFTLVPPAGISLDPSETQYTKSIPQINANSEGSVSWLVRANGSRTGILSYYVAMSASPMGSAVVKRDIHVPAVSTQPFQYGWQQMSVPFELTDTNPATVLGLQPGSLRKIFRYDPSLPSNTQYYPYEEVTSLVPGEAYWLNLYSPSSATLTPGQYRAKDWSGTTGYEIPVHTGWNMIGNPYIYTVTTGELSFLTTSYGSLTYDEAIAQHLISRTLYWWNTTFNTWNWSTQRTAQLKPWQGYWFKVIDPMVQAVVISPAAQIGASVGGEAPAGGDDDGGGPPVIP